MAKAEEVGPIKPKNESERLLKKGLKVYSCEKLAAAMFRIWRLCLALNLSSLPATAELAEGVG
jgi:hypothetical protein